jgi:hypothetical protein
MFFAETAFGIMFSAAVFHESLGIGIYVAEHISRRRNQDRLNAEALRILKGALI